MRSRTSTRSDPTRFRYLAFRGSDIIETQPIYLKGDANCCPSGGFDHRRFHWNGTKFVVARFWHDKTYKV